MSRRLRHESRLFLYAVLAGLPGSVAALWLLWSGVYSSRIQWTLTLIIAATWLGFAFAVRERTVMPLQTLANLIESLREGDYSIRAREPAGRDALGDVMVEVNELGELLRSQRFLRLDATTLLQQVIQEVDVAVFTFDEEGTLRLANRAAERMMAQPQERLLGRSAAELGLEDSLRAEDLTTTFEHTFPGQTGRWQARRSTFRESGRPTHLLVLSDLSKALRAEERQAWQRLIRVLGHELNNSLAPIKSTASTLAGILRRDDPHEGWRDDAQRGLVMIADRCESLNRFVVAYSKLARLPAPQRSPLSVAPLIRRVVGFETRRQVRVEEPAEGESQVIRADRAQLEQLLINLIKNAVEAVMENDGDVVVTWSRGKAEVEIRVLDTGPGLAATHNLFVPFFTTKPGGSGIGLVLCRQIAEAHSGRLTLENRQDTESGCVAKLSLPI